MDDHLSFHLPILEVTLKDVTVVLGQLAQPVLPVVFPQSHVGVTVFPRQCPLTVFHPFLEVAGVFVAVGVAEDAQSRALALCVVALVDIPITELVDAFAVLYVVAPVTHVDIAVGIFVGALARALVVGPLAVVGSAVAPVEEALAVFHVVEPLAAVVGSIGKSVGAFALPLVLKPLTVVAVAIVVVHHPVPLLIVAEPQAHILVVVHEIISALAVLLVLKPLPFIFLSVGKSVDAVALPPAFHVFSLVGVAVGKYGVALTVGLT